MNDHRAAAAAAMEAAAFKYLQKRGGAPQGFNVLMTCNLRVKDVITDEEIFIGGGRNYCDDSGAAQVAANSSGDNHRRLCVSLCVEESIYEK